MDTILEFKKSKPFSIGVELEFQLINLHNYNLILESEDFLRRTKATRCKNNIKPEITQSMMEINSSIHSDYYSLIDELTSINVTLLDVAKKMHIGICGGGTHPFQKWSEQKIFENERFLSVSEQYGFLAKQFTVFGQHIHIGCQSGEDALYLCHALAYYIPHFIALSASSPFSQSIDTSFDCSRLSVISAFPLSGTPPWIFEWNKFHQYFEKLYHLNVVKSMKDFYWDIRPKPEYGTVEIRICDTPLSIQTACDIAFYANCLTRYLLENRPEISKEVYLTYLINRFRASRFGLNAQLIDAATATQKILKEDVLETCCKIEKYAEKNGSSEGLDNIRNIALNNRNDAKLLREKFSETGALEDVVRFQMDSWSLHTKMQVF